MTARADRRPTPLAVRQMRNLGIPEDAIARCLAENPHLVDAEPAPLARPYAPYKSKWEADYAAYLELRKLAGQIEGWSYETERLALGGGATYRPDFPVIECDGSKSYHEVKGYRREAAIVRIKVAAGRYPDRAFYLVTKKAGSWQLERQRA